MNFLCIALVISDTKENLHWTNTSLVAPITRQLSTKLRLSGKKAKRVPVGTKGPHSSGQNEMSAFAANNGTH